MWNVSSNGLDLLNTIVRLTAYVLLATNRVHNFINEGDSMKALVVILSVFAALASQAQSCRQLEAQIIATVESVTYYPKESLCMAKLKYSHFDSSIMCPLDQSDVDGKDVMIKGCSSRTLGMSIVSGVLVDDGQSLYLEQ